MLPLVCFLLLVAVLLQARPGAAESPCWRTAFLKAAGILGLLIWLGTEFLSVLGALSLQGLAVCWTLACVTVGALWVMRRRSGLRLCAPGRERLDVLSGSLLLCTLFIAAATGIIALVSPPNNYDSMTYHMSRVAHWAQNQSVAFYPTHIPRQNYLGPFAEFGVLHLYVLWGGDRLANMVQWSCMIGSLVAVSLIAARLGAGMRGQALAALVCATIPMGILQASSTQTDYAAAFWLAAFAALILPLIRGDDSSRSCWMLAGAVLGLAILTKATAYLFGLPFVLWLIVARLRKRGWRSLGSLFLMACGTLGINLPHYARNYQLTGSPLGPRQGSEAVGIYTNAAFGPRLLGSNVLRNAGLHFVRTMSEAVNRWCLAAIPRLHRSMGIGLNDPRITYLDTEFPTKTTYSTCEDWAGNPAHALLIAAATGTILLVPRFRRTPLLAAYLLCVVGGLLIFCAYLRWQPWNTRLHLPAFVLASAFVATALSEWKVRGLVLAVAAVLVVLALSPVFRNLTRSLVGGSHNILTVSRRELYFANSLWRREEPYVGAAHYVKEHGFCKIGLYFTDDDEWEYPFWVLLGAPKSHSAALRIEHVGVTDLSARLDWPVGAFRPDAVICVTEGPISSLKLDAGNYSSAASFSGLRTTTVLVRDSSATCGFR
jgi:hypothetical protein